MSLPDFSLQNSRVMCYTKSVLSFSGSCLEGVCFFTEPGASSTGVLEDVVEAPFFFFFPDGKAGRGGTELTFLGREAQRGVGWEVLARALAVQCSGRYLLPDVRWRAEGVNL